jgi:sodium-dependent dicarboxylate transporter 2/3/5
MCLPVSTPPNALAYATGQCKSKDFIFMGLVMGLLGPVLGLIWSSVIVDKLVGWD